MTKRLRHTSGRIKFSAEESLVRIYRYCAYQERSHQEVRNKLYEFGLKESEVEEFLTRLITEGFLNEERFAKAFSGGKFRIKKWGRLKIHRELSQRGLTENCIMGGMREINASDYLRTLEELVRRKSGQMEEVDLFRKRSRVARFVIAKGYEPDLVWEIVKECVPK